jgi:transcriptional antiterminator RfaH
MSLSENWYVLQSHVRKEELLCHQVTTQGVESYFPQIPAFPVNPRARSYKPYFPGYLFVHIDLASSGLSTFQWMPYAVGLVSFGGEPAVVPDAFIYLLRQKIDALTPPRGETLPLAIKPGEPVMITSGPFARYAAVFNTSISGTKRVRVLLKMLNNRYLPIELNADQVGKQ